MLRASNHLRFLIIILVAGTACEAMGARNSGPDWVVHPPQDGMYLYAAGISAKSDLKEARAEAVAMGISTIAAAVLSVVSESYDQMTDEIRTSISDRVNFRTAQSLEGVEVVEVSRVGAHTHALVRCPRTEIPRARMQYVHDKREAEQRAELLMNGLDGDITGRTVDVHVPFDTGPSVASGERIRTLIHSLNLLEPYGGFRYEAARQALFAAIAELDLRATRSGNDLQVTPADIPVRLGSTRFSDRLKLSGADRLRNVVTVDTLPLCALIDNEMLARDVAAWLEKKSAKFQWMSTMLTTGPKVAIFPAQDQASEVSAILIQSALTNVKIIDRRMLGGFQIRNILDGKPQANVGIDYLVVVTTSIMPANSGWITQLVWGNQASYQISTVVEVINPTTAEIVKTIITQTLASQADFKVGLAFSKQLLPFSESKGNAVTHGIVYVVGELNKVLNTSGCETQ